MLQTKDENNFTHQTGFQSPADDFLEKDIDLNDFLIKHPAATFFVRVDTDAMVAWGYYPNDILIVDKSVHAMHGSLIIALFDSEFVFKRLYKQGETCYLVSASKKYKPIYISSESDFTIWGVVICSIHYDTLHA